MQEFFVIAIGNMFVAQDVPSGGYRYATDYFPSALFFKSKEEALKELEGTDWTRPNSYSDGTISPPSMLHRMFEINNKKLEARGVLEIRKVTFQAVWAKDVEAKMIKPVD